MNSAAEKISAVCIAALRNGNKILFCGNGGSAADSQHLAAELVGKLNFDRPPLAALSLTVDTSVITAIGNDYGFEHVFSRQIEAIGKEGDVLIVMSTSGKSKNILNAVEMANNMGMITIGKTGRIGKELARACDVTYVAPSLNTQEIQEYHIKIGHEYCSMIEAEMFPQ